MASKLFLEKTAINQTKKEINVSTPTKVGSRASVCQ